MLHRVERRELTCTCSGSSPCNIPQPTLFLLLLLLNTWHQHISSQFTPVPCFSPDVYSVTNAIIKSCRILLPAPAQSQQSHQWHCKHLPNPEFPFIHKQLLCSARTSRAAVQGMESTYSPSAPRAVYRLYRERKASNSCLSWHLLGFFW